MMILICSPVGKLCGTFFCFKFQGVMESKIYQTSWSLLRSHMRYELQLFFKDEVPISGGNFNYFSLSKLPKWSLRFGHFYHFSPKLKPFESRSLWFQFCCDFQPKAKPRQIFQLTFIFRAKQSDFFNLL
ncbi:hypothetical protein Hanom_Chr04g00336971 [Helianthus anomalus]